MEKPDEKASDILNEGPLRTFKLEIINNLNPYTVQGWITVPEYPDNAILVQVTFDNDSYLVNFMDEFGNTIVPGLFYWKTSNKIATTPESEIHYNQVFEYGELTGWMDNDNQPFDSYEYQVNPFKDIPSLQQAFGTGYIYNKHLPISIRKIDQKILKPLLDDPMFEYFLDYETLSPKQKQTIHSAKIPSDFEPIILSFITPLELQVMTERLNNKLKDSGLTDEEPVIKNIPESGHGTKKDLIRRYIIERVYYQIRNFGTIDVSKLLTDIEQLEICGPAIREEFNNHLEKLKQDDDMRRVKAITAKGIITCNPGLLVWD